MIIFLSNLVKRHCRGGTPLDKIQKKYYNMKMKINFNFGEILWDIKQNRAS